MLFFILIAVTYITTPRLNKKFKNLQYLLLKLFKIINKYCTKDALQLHLMSSMEQELLINQNTPNDKNHFIKSRHLSSNITRTKIIKLNTTQFLYV